MLPNFICPGVQKSGTTTLHEILNKHPEIFLPACKETYFFHQHYRKSASNSLRYESSFFSDANHKAVGEICPAYMAIDAMPERMHDLLGKDLKLIFSLRHPVDRAFSAYKMYYTGLIDTSENFEQAIRNDAFELNELKKLNYIGRGLYYKRLKEYLDYFPKENMQFFIFEDDIKQNLDKTIKSILEFLDVDTDFHFNPETKINQNADSYYEILETDTEVSMNETPNQSHFSKLKGFMTGSNKNTKIIPKGSVKLMLRHTPVKYITNPSDKFLKDLKQYKKPKKPSESLRNQMLTEHFSEDIKRTEDLIGRDLQHWMA